MAYVINRVFLAGANLTRDCEKKELGGGTILVKFSVALNERKKQCDEWIDEPSYFDCAYFGKAADAVSPYLVKGCKVVVDGRLKQRRWKAEDGGNRSAVEIICDTVLLSGEKAKKDYDNGQPTAAEYPTEGWE